MKPPHELPSPKRIALRKDLLQSPPLPTSEPTNFIPHSLHSTRITLPTRSRELRRKQPMFTRIRYQHGCIAREARKAGPDVWIFRWREINAEGRKVNRKAVVGTVEQYRTESVAQKSVDALRININQETVNLSYGLLRSNSLCSTTPRRSCQRTRKKPTPPRQSTRFICGLGFCRDGGRTAYKQLNQ